MPWQEVNRVSLRQEFIQMSRKESMPFSALCQRFSISRKTGYKWLERYNAFGEAGLLDRSKTPHNFPNQASQEIEKHVRRLREKHPAWGARKLRARLQNLGHTDLPSAGCIHKILQRNGLITVQETSKPWQRFEKEYPNHLWQMDFKGHFPTLDGGRCHPLTVLDDHSRYSLVLKACDNEQGKTVQKALTQAFRQYGLPYEMLMDNGGPWGNPEGRYTVFSAWLIRLGIKVSHSRPHHPQTQGKEERFHRTLQAEVLSRRVFRGLRDCQQALDSWRQVYNHQRPHQALEMKCPDERYRFSPIAYPESLPPIEYGPEDVVRKVLKDGFIAYKGKRIKACSSAFRGQPVALRPTGQEGILAVYFCHQRVGQIDLKKS